MFFTSLFHTYHFPLKDRVTFPSFYHPRKALALEDSCPMAGAYWLFSPCLALALPPQSSYPSLVPALLSLPPILSLYLALSLALVLPVPPFPRPCPFASVLGLFLLPL